MTDTDRTIASIGLPAHPAPKVLAQHLREVAKLIDDDGRMAILAAGQLAARGWGASTLGDGIGSPSTSDETSVERSVIGAMPDDDKPHDLEPGHWDDADRRLATLQRLLWKAGLDYQQLATDLLSHASDVDEIPVGRGECECCGRMCDPAKNPNDRLRSGFCDACRKAWERANRPPRSDWTHAHRHRLREGQPGVCERCDRPWTKGPGDFGVTAAEGAAALRSAAEAGFSIEDIARGQAS